MALVLPPTAISATMALWKASLVMNLAGLRSCQALLTIWRPLSAAMRQWRASLAREWLTRLGSVSPQRLR